jgi:radical SAM superfamily enzyme YgiQ (UPF0313 family)
MIYKQNSRFRIRPVADIQDDLAAAREAHGSHVKTLFFTDGNTVAMPTADLARICRRARDLFPHLERITIYGSSQYIHMKGLGGMKKLADAGWSRIHVGLESGDDAVLKRIKKGSTSRQQIQAGQWVRQAGIELSEYVILGIGGREHSDVHAANTARVLNHINPDFIRLRTFVPKINTPLLEDVQQGRFEMLGPLGVLGETHALVQALVVNSRLTSDHYTNYINLAGQLPDDQPRFLSEIRQALTRDEATFRPIFIGKQ